MTYIHDRDVDDYLAECVTINDGEYVSEYTRISADLYYWNARYAEAEEAYSKAKVILRESEARAYLRVREQLLTDSRKPPTVDQMSAVVQVQPEVTVANRELVAAVKRRSDAKGVVEAIGAKKDMLMQLGATKRQEMKSLV